MCPIYMLSQLGHKARDVRPMTANRLENNTVEYNLIKNKENLKKIHIYYIYMT